MHRVHLQAAAIAIAALLQAGCSSQPPAIIPAEGTVLLNGQPLPHAQVDFVPMIQGFGAEYIATATTDEKGRFKLTCNGGVPGACACENRVTVIEGPFPENVRGNQTAEGRFLNTLSNRPIPIVYSSVANTPLIITVSAERTDYTLELKR